MTTLVRLMSGDGWPLFDEEGGTGPENWPGLSPGLVDRLAAWDLRHGMNYALTGSAGRAFARTHMAEGEELCRALAEELSPEYVVWLHPTAMRLPGRGAVVCVDES